VKSGEVRYLNLDPNRHSIYAPIPADGEGNRPTGGRKVQPQREPEPPRESAVAHRVQR
jgi:hypothetical protein